MSSLKNLFEQMDTIRAMALMRDHPDLTVEEARVIVKQTRERFGEQYREDDIERDNDSAR